MASLRAVSGVARPLTSAVRPKTINFEDTATNLETPTTKLVSEQVTVLERRIIKFSSLIRCTPFDWDPLQDSFVVTSEFQRFVAMYLNFAYIVGYEGYLVTRFVQNELNPSESYATDKAFLEFWSLTLLTLISYQLAMFAKFKEMPNMHRRAKRWFARIDHYLDQHTDLKEGVENDYEKNLGSGLQLDIPFTILWVLPSVLYPTQKMYFSSAIGEFQDGHHFWYSAFNVVTFGYFVATWYTMMYIWSITYISVTLELPAVAKIIRKSVEKRYDESFMLYREAQVMTQELNNVCSTTIMPSIKWLTAFALTYTLYSGMMSEDWPSKILLIVYFVVWLPTMQLLFKHMGMFWTESNSVTEVAARNWRSDSFWRRRARSLAPLKIIVGGSYFIDELTELVLIDFMLTSSIGLVVASRSD